MWWRDSARADVTRVFVAGFMMIAPQMSNKNTKRQCRHRTTTTTASLTARVIGVSTHEAREKPEFIRLPKSGQRCPWTGMSRASLNELVLGSGAPVHSVVLRREGASRGIRLIHLESLLLYLHQEMEDQISSKPDDNQSTAKTDSRV